MDRLSSGSLPRLASEKTQNKLITWANIETIVTSAIEISQKALNTLLMLVQWLVHKPAQSVDCKLNVKAGNADILKGTYNAVINGGIIH